MKLFLLMILMSLPVYSQHTGSSGGPSSGLDEHAHNTCAGLRKAMVLEYKNNISGKRMVVFKNRYFAGDYKKFIGFLEASVVEYTKILEEENLIIQLQQCNGVDAMAMDDFGPQALHAGLYTNLISLMGEFRFNSCHQFEAEGYLDDPEKTDTYIKVLEGLNGDSSGSDL